MHNNEIRLGGGNQHYNGKENFLHTCVTLLDATKGLEPGSAFEMLTTKLERPGIY